MSMRHGVYVKQVDTSISTPVTANSGIPFVVGSAPVQMVDGTVNEPILCSSYAEAVTAFGYSDDWEKYSLCEVIYAWFQLYSVAPLVLVNVLDPSTHKTPVEASSFSLTEGQAFLPLEALKDTVEVTGYSSEDYTLFYSGEALVLEVSATGSIPATSTSLEISYTALDPALLSQSDIIGGFNIQSKQKTGFELIDSVYPKYGIVVDTLLAPGWSHHSEIAAIMSAKAESIGGFFEGKAIIDVDDTEVDYYSNATEWKKEKGITSKYQVLCYPSVKLGDKKFHLSTHFACRMAKTDTDNGGCPHESPSNKALQIDSTVAGDDVPVYLGVDEANYLNSNGIVTAINHASGFVLWGNECACFPSDSDVKNYFISVSRMFAWVSNTVIQSFWSKIDKPMSKLLAESIITTINLWLNGLKTEGKLLGGKIEFLDEENPVTSLVAGVMVFHIYLTPPSPAKEIEFVLEYDPDNLTFAMTS